MSTPTRRTRDDLSRLGRDSRVRRLALVVALGLALLAGSQAQALTSQAAGPRGTPVPRSAGETGSTGKPGPSAAGVAVDPRQASSYPEGETPERVPEAPRRYPVDGATFGLLKARANADAAANVPGTTPGADQGPAPAFSTLKQCDGDNGCWHPPDGGLAAGPTSLLVAVNEAFGLYDKAAPNTAKLGPVSFNNFFGTGDSIYDPRALYDAGNGAPGVSGYGDGHGRFVLLATTGGTYTLAVSLRESPESLATPYWCKYSIPAATTLPGGATTWADFPGLGMDGDNLYITSNQYTDSFQYARLLVIPKASVYGSVGGDGSATCPTATSTDFLPLTQPDNSLAFTVQPANQPDALPGMTSTMYLVSAIWASADSLVVGSLTTKPTLTLNARYWIGVSPYNLPADAPQRGGTLIDTFDTRLLGATYRYGKIYTANTTRTVSTARLSGPMTGRANANANVQWYAITPTGATTFASPASTYAVGGGNVGYFIAAALAGCAGTVTRDAGGAASCSTAPFVALEFSGSGANQVVAAYRFRSGKSPAIYAKGTSYATSRWGDYPGVAADPDNAALVWVLGEYARAPDSWGTAVEKVTPAVP